jgi:hypothetical protein
MPDQPPPSPPPLPDPGGLPYGPNTPAVRRFLQRFAALRPSEWDAAGRRYEAAQASPAFAAADRALAQAVERAGRTAERDAVVGPLVQLVRDAPRPSRPAGDAGAGGDGLALLPPVAEAALAALLALVVRDVLAEPAFATLYAPFTTLVPLDALGPAAPGTSPGGVPGGVPGAAPARAPDPQAPAPRAPADGSGE